MSDYSRIRVSTCVHAFYNSEVIILSLCALLLLVCRYDNKQRLLHTGTGRLGHIDHTDTIIVCFACSHGRKERYVCTYACQSHPKDRGIISSQVNFRPNRSRVAVVSTELQGLTPLS